MSRRGRQHEEHEEHENHERWLISYADMMTLLFAVFVVMYAISSVNKSKFEAFQSSLTQDKKTGQPDLTVPNENRKDVPPKPGNPLSHAGLEELKAKLEAELVKAGLSAAARLEIDSNGLSVSLTDGVLFDTGQAVLRGEGQRVLEVIGPRLNEFSNPVTVEGHTDDVPIRTAKYEDNWDLSTARATSVVRFFLGHYHVPGDRLTATGYADTRPKVPNDSPEHRSVNRRVVILISDPAAGQAPEAPAAEPAPAEPPAPAHEEQAPAEEQGGGGH